VLQQQHEDEKAKRTLAAQMMAQGRWQATQVTDPEMASLLNVQVGTRVPNSVFTAALTHMKGGKELPSGVVLLDTDAKRAAYLKANPGATIPPDNIVERSAYNPKSGGAFGMDEETRQNIHAVVKGVRNGTIAPDVTKLGRNAKINLAIYRELEDAGYNTRKATLEWAVQSQLAKTAGGSKQVIIAQNIDSLLQSMDKLDELNAQMVRAGYPTMAALQNAIKRGGLRGDEAASLMRQLDNQSKIVTTEAGGVYQNGNAPTDIQIKKAMSMLDTAWDQKVFGDATKLLRENVTYKRNAIYRVLSGDIPGSPGYTGASGDDVDSKLKELGIE
jgi:hypothetical protein